MNFIVFLLFNIGCQSFDFKLFLLMIFSYFIFFVLVIWGEPLNYNEIISRMQIEQLLLESGITLIFVELDSAFVRNVASKKVKI